MMLRKFHADFKELHGDKRCTIQCQAKSLQEARVLMYELAAEAGLNDPAFQSDIQEITSEDTRRAIDAITTAQFSG